MFRKIVTAIIVVPPAAVLVAFAIANRQTATVSFGQSMPEKPMLRAQELAKSCDLFLVIGSSLVVWPAAGFPLVAKRNGSRLVIINRDRTEFDEIADLVDLLTRPGTRESALDGAKILGRGMAGERRRGQP